MGDACIEGGGNTALESGQSAMLAATRDLLWITSPTDAKATAIELVEALGGMAVPADIADHAALGLDVSFGDGVPLVPWAPHGSAAHRLLTRAMPAFVRDAHRALELAARTQRLAEDASTDPLTRLPNRGKLGRALGRLRPGDTVIMLDLDDFKQINDQLGHAEGDRVLVALGSAIADSVRARDQAGRYGGEEFIIILGAEDDGGGADADAYLQRLRTTWERVRPNPVSFSAGIARVDRLPSQVLVAADEALYQAKRAGRNRWRWACDGQSTPAAGSTSAVAPPAAQSAFVAYSRLTVPEPGREALETAFENRLARVDRWPGFQRLEVWADRANREAFVMVSWWDGEESFRAYMRSEDHRASHARIPSGESPPRLELFRRYEVIAR